MNLFITLLENVNKSRTSASNVSLKGIADRHRQGFRLQNKPTSKQKTADLCNQNS
jgi:hypothetical protein